MGMSKKKNYNKNNLKNLEKLKIPTPNFKTHPILKG
jgi:hypothetical protein